jgi:hypothetical protein
MANFDPELVQVMKTALEDIMAKVPLEFSTTSTKAYLAECILRSAAQGERTYDGLMAAVTEQIPTILSLFV